MIHGSEALLGGVYVPRLNFKPFRVASLEGSPVTVGISCERLVVHHHFSFFMSVLQAHFFKKLPFGDLNIIVKWSPKKVCC